MTNIFRRIAFNLLKFKVYALWYLHLDRFLGKFIGYLTVSYNKQILEKDKIGILAMERGIFDYDVAALKKQSSNYQIIVFPTLARALLFDEAKKIQPQELLEQTVFYAKKDEYTEHYNRLSNIFSHTLDYFEKKTKSKIKVVLTANIDYFQDYPWIKTIHDRSGKFVALEKESIVYMYTDKKNISERHHKYNFKFDGDAVLFYNYLGRDIYVEVGSVKASQAYVSGCPRVDRLVELSKNKSKKTDNAVIASFMQPYYFATKVWDEVIHSIYADELLKEKTIIKCKNKEEVKSVNNDFSDIAAVSDSLENYLIKNPAIFVGYNSTACYDALIAGVPVMVPFWGETHQKGDDALVGEHSSSFHHLAKSKSEFVSILKDYIKGDTSKYKDFGTVFDDKKLKEFLEKRYSRVDGKNCERFYEYIDKILNK